MIYFFSRKVLKPVSESYEKTDCKTDFPRGKTGVSLQYGRFPQFQNRGFGIGLSVVYAIVKAHKGKISAKSEDGKSILFTVVL